MTWLEWLMVLTYHNNQREVFGSIGEVIDCVDLSHKPRRDW